MTSTVVHKDALNLGLFIANAVRASREHTRTQGQVHIHLCLSYNLALFGALTWSLHPNRGSKRIALKSLQRQPEGHVAAFRREKRREHLILKHQTNRTPGLEASKSCQDDLLARNWTGLINPLRG
jgi:hypothetical protein